MAKEALKLPLSFSQIPRQLSSGIRFGNDELRFYSMAGETISEPSVTLSHNAVVEVRNNTEAARKRSMMNGTVNHILILEESRRDCSEQSHTTVQSDEVKNCPPESNNAVQRLVLRTVAYFVYDQFSITGGHKEMARIGKAFVELVVDERFPPPHRVDMTFRRKCLEYLFAPAVSSLMWFLTKSIRTQRTTAAKPKMRSRVLAKALWTVVHRVGRQALIYRMFFRIDSLRYSLASALGIICCFFKETLFRDLLRFDRWPRHFSSSQGIAAILRSLVYAVAFSLPLQRYSNALQESPRRRGNIKKIVFAVALSQSQRLLELGNRICSSHAWAV